MNTRHRREHHHPLDINSDDHGSEASNSTLLHEHEWDQEHDELVGEDRDGGPDHHLRHRPGKGASDN
jgi:hypothetical protein